MGLIKSILFSRSLLILFLSIFLSAMAKAPPLVGGPAPQFELQTVDEQTIKLSDFKGQFVVLNFWATWCVPCMQEMPELQKTHLSSGNDTIKIIAINLSESQKRVDKFIQDHQLSFSVLLDGFGNTSEKYKVRSLPVTYIISPDGIIREEIQGGGLTQEIIEAKINQIKNFAFNDNTASPDSSLEAHSTGRPGL
ncbi:MAG: TlpA disulfide reductase family protein [Nitrospinae bacterium]|jgi:peroxiredoxin|nr:TlpA disulfide reductase family protein [Nitrospinota bacterium]MDA1108911.1 TlpA disulfide reductase family protein [Nitrospinota bacterium]